MSHYINVPLNETGIMFDKDMNRVVQEAIAVAPFGFNDVFLYSHGWSNSAVSMMNEYNRFTVDFAQRVILIEEDPKQAFPKPPGASLGIGIHWPSEITEDPNSVLNDLQLFTFYTMEHRADVVGRNGVYAMLRLLLTSRKDGPPLRVCLIGHSFGCKVVCAALQDLQIDIAGGSIVPAAGTQLRAVLLQPATDNDHLEKGDIYGDVLAIDGLRMLITHSQEDLALTKWFRLAGKIANVFKKEMPALGDTGPTPTTFTMYGAPDQVTVTGSLLASDIYPLKAKLVVADLTPIHAARVAAGYEGGFSGSHSDINFDQIYYLVAGFLFS